MSEVLDQCFYLIEKYRDNSHKIRPENSNFYRGQLYYNNHYKMSVIRLSLLEDIKYVEFYLVCYFQRNGSKFYNYVFQDINPNVIMNRNEVIDYRDREIFFSTFEYFLNHKNLWKRDEITIEILNQHENRIFFKEKISMIWLNILINLRIELI